MTDQAALALDPPGEASGKGKGGRLAMIGGLVAVTLLAVAAGTATAFLIATPTPPAPEATAEDVAPSAQNPAAYASADGPLMLVPMEPVVTNISSPPATIIRVEASLVVSADVDEPQLLATQIAADTLAFARSLELAQIEGSRGLLHLREDLKERAMLRSPAVADYVIHALIAQ